MALLVLIIPFVGFFINSTIIRILFGSESLISGYINSLFIGISLLLSLIILFNPSDITNQINVTWLNLFDLNITFGLLIDPLTSIMMVVVSGISFLVQIYSLGYMHGDKSYTRYFAYMSLFTGSMLGLVMSRNILQLFIFWELVGVTSYLLIGFWFNRSSAAVAAKKAFIMTRFGDFGFLFSIIYLFNFNPSSLDIIELYKMIAAGTISTKIATIASLGFLFGAIGKSAQFPLHSWLPDAMEGPTSVSALIHSATMVTAGVFLIARLFPLFDHSQIMILIASIGAITSLIAATMGLTSTDIKRVLAYSTISQLGYMVMALGLGAYSAAIFHLFTHAFFKAGLFLCAGSVHHASGTFNMKFMGGLQSKMKLTYYSMLICGVSLAGIFPLSGFWSKDEIILSTFNHGGFIGYLFLLIGLIVAFMTAFYMFRTISLTFYGSFRGGGDQERKVLQSNNIEVPETVQSVHLEESPKFMTYPLIVLSFFAIFIGYVVNPVFFDLIFINKHAFSEFLEKSLEIYHYHGTHSFNFNIALLSTFMAILGSLFALNTYRTKTEIYRNSLMKNINYLLDKKYFIDYLYEKIIVENIFYETICRSLAWIDNNIFDQINILLSNLSYRFGFNSLKLQDGQIHSYGLAMILSGIVSVLILILLG
jgi:NADH-quinone oxidoreductase subunit L|tara:strand:- start:2706 stop:4655 length:1950 start_codon:yes stop_codon:yes gene_type:complete